MSPDLDDDAFAPDALAHMRSIRWEIEDAVAAAARGGSGSKPERPIREVPPERVVEEVMASAERVQEMVDRISKARR